MFAKTRLIGLGCLLLASAAASLAFSPSPFLHFSPPPLLAFSQVDDQQAGDTAMEKSSKKIKQKFVDATGAAAPTKDDLAAVELAAQYFVYRLTWPEYADNQEALARAIKEFNKEYKQRIVENNAIQRETVLAFHKALRVSFNKVLVERDFTKNRLTSVNVAQLLPVLGKSKTEEISDLLTGLINDPKQNDAVKLYAIRGLKEYFYPPLDPAALNNTVGDVKRVQTLTNYIERKWDIKGASKEEIAGVSYLRREAIRCLAQAQVAAVKFPNKQVQGQTASTFLRVLAKDALDPPPTLEEKCAAAFALCNIKSLPRDYQSDMATYAIANTLGQFINEYREDQKNLKKGGIGPRLPWKALGDEWDTSLTNLVANNSKDANAALVKKDTESLLNAIRNYQNPEEMTANRFINETVPKKLKSNQKIPFKYNTSADRKPLDVELGYD